MTETAAVLPPSDDDPVVGPGQRLKVAREAQQLTLEQVSVQLKLPQRVLEAIERDDYPALPEPTFVRGYLRSYSRFMALPVDVILREYEDLTGYRKAAPKQIRAYHESIPHAKERHLTWIFALLALGLVITLALWWKDQDKNPALSLSDNALEWLQQNHAPASEESSGGALILPAPEEVPPEKNPADASATNPPVSAPESPPPPVVEVAPPVPTLGTLIFRLETDSWVDIQDVHQKSLHRGTLKKGIVRTFTGTPPFSITLGHAQGVKLEYNGHPVDFKNSIQGSRARFTVGQTISAPQQ